MDQVSRLVEENPHLMSIPLPDAYAVLHALAKADDAKPDAEPESETEPTPPKDAPKDKDKGKKADDKSSETTPPQ